MDLGTRIDLAPPADFAGADDIISNLGKERESLDRDNRTLVITSILILRLRVMEKAIVHFSAVYVF